MASDEARFDLIVIGAGINGAAIAREAALLGLSVLLIDSGDLCSGTSAASTRLIHGGLRYLEYGELNLVYESLAERERLLRTAPHLVAPLEFVLPVYQRGRRRKWQIRIGMWLYDVLSASKSTPPHTMLSRSEVIDRLGGIDSRGLLGGASYFDAQLTYPERLVIEIVRDAVDHGVTLITYAAVNEISVAEGVATGIRWTSVGGRSGSARARFVVNAAGPWVDEVVAGIALKRLIGGTRGSHLILEPFDGAPSIAVYTEAASDGRPFFVIPWNGLCLIGTTDERTGPGADGVAASDAEIDYLLGEAERLFRTPSGLADRLLYTYAGVRPLPYKPKGATGAITRRHLIRRHRNARGLYSVVGGKLTTHRALAVDVMARLRRRDRTVPRGSKTESRMLPGGLDIADRRELLEQIGARYGSTEAGRLWHLYGAAAQQVTEPIRSMPELGQSVSAASGTIVAELLHAIEHEWAHSLIDIFQRRSMTGLAADFGIDAARPAAESLVRLGIWDRARADNEVQAYFEYARRFRARGLRSARGR